MEILFRLLIVLSGIASIPAGIFAGIIFWIIVNMGMEYLAMWADSHISLTMTVFTYATAITGGLGVMALTFAILVWLLDFIFNGIEK